MTFCSNNSLAAYLKYNTNDGAFISVPDTILKATDSFLIEPDWLTVYHLINLQHTFLFSILNN